MNLSERKVKKMHPWRALWMAEDEDSQRKVRSILITVFTVSVLVGMLFVGLSSWADFEAYMFDSSTVAATRLSTMKCPVMIGKNEIGTIAATFTNNTDKNIQPLVKFHLTDGYVSSVQEQEQVLPIPIGESKKLTWVISAKDAAWDLFIMARVVRLGQYKAQSATATCGVIVVGLPLPGWLMTVLFVLLTVLGAGWGVWAWYRRYSPLKGKNRNIFSAMSAISLVLLVALIAVLLQSWFLGGSLLILMVILIFAVSGYFMLNS